MLIVLTIISILGVMMVSIFNSFGITNKARDAQRKKDLNRIKIAFEDYFNDKGSYPKNIDSWNVEDNCGKSVDVFPNLHPWPCDPNGSIYKIKISPESNKFIILTELENKKDKDIPDGLYSNENFNYVESVKANANYGVSSSNILWYDGGIFSYNDNCDVNTCYKKPLGGGCNSVETVCNKSSDGECYYGSKNGNCSNACRVICCGNGCSAKQN